MKADKKKMFNSVLSSLGKYLFQGGNGNLAEDEGCMIQIPAGELYAMRSSLSGRSASIKECLFKESTLTIIRKATYQYELRVQRVFEEGEEELLREEAEDEGEGDLFIASTLVFQLNSKMDFKRKTSSAGGISFAWVMAAALPDSKSHGNASSRDIHAKAFERWLKPYSTANKFEYIPDKAVTAHTIQFFHQTLAQCLYETTTKRPFTEASHEVLEAIMAGESVESLLKVGNVPCYLKPEKVHQEDLSKYIVKEFNNIPFYVYETESGIFQPQSLQTLVRFLKGDSSYSFSLWIQDLSGSEERRKLLYHQPISPTATQHVERSSLSFVWCCLDNEGAYWTFSVRFPEEKSLFAFANQYAKCVFEILNKESLKKEDEDYLISSFIQEVQMKPESGSDYSDSDSQEDSSEDSDDEILAHRISAVSSKQDDKNSLLALGFKSDRSFVSRGHSIGVFKNTSDNKLAFHTTIKGVSNLKGQTFTPEKMMLHEQDSSLILMNPLQKDRLFKMDLELGKVIEEWKISDSDASVTSIVPDSKYAQMTGNKTLIGLNKNSIFRIDPRLPGCKRVEEETKQYVSKNEFNCGATTGKGELAVASGKGEIRLFNKLDKRAKTLLPGFGDPILGIDVSESGKFILATCKSYLLFIDASLDQQDATGFSKAMGTANKPIPKRLQLSSEHVAYMGGKSTLAFTEAHFSTGPSEEKAIIAATGPYVITWKLKDVLKGNLFDYAIKKYSDNVVADNFKYGQDRSIIVTLPNEVTMVSKSHLMTPKRSKNSFSDIVDSPF